MRTTSTNFKSVVMVLLASACGEPELATQLNTQRAGAPPNNTGTTPVTAQPQPGQSQQGAQAQPQAGQGPSSSEASPAVTQLAPTVPAPTDGNGTPGGAEVGAPMEDTDEPVVVDPYAPRTGAFKMLVYSRTTGFRHDSIAQGKAMLQQIAGEQGFEITETEVNDLITPEGLAQFEIVFFMNSTGDIFNQAEEAAFQDWMEKKNGAMAGAHSATDTEQGWAFYKEVTGQYYDGHVNANTPGAIQFEADMVEFPALKGLPNPWQRNEEWYRFNSFQEWTSKPGFKVLGRKQADNQPIMWVREFGNWRSFYTAIGHDAAVFRDPVVKQHLTGGILWAVRRDQLLP